jgi:RNA polymerase sigma-54 factor
MPFLEKFNEAKVLIRSVKQRGDTILKVAQAIVEKQQGFFEHGDLAMQPLLLKEIAETVSLHESTISRVTNQKYLQSSRGTFSFKYFFGGQISREAGETVSAKAIQTLIKQMIQSEPTEKPLSDGDISTLLNNEGYQIARRTIVKYREILRIPPVHSRKKLNQEL